MSLSVDVACDAPFAIDATFEVRRGRTLALVGESGAGKTTVLRLIAGFARPDRGRITNGAEEWFDAAAGIFAAPHRRTIGMTFSRGALFGDMTALENAMFGPRAAGWAADRARARALEALELTGASALRDRRAATLSAGETQRVALARAIALRPHVLLLDEPLSSVDVHARAGLRTALSAAMRATDAATVLVTHDPAEALLMADEIAVLENGRIVQQGSSADLRRAPATPYVAAFAGVNLFTGTARALADGTSEIAVGDAAFVVHGAFTGPVALVVDPDAVTLSREEGATSARNRVHGVVDAIVPDGGAVRVAIASVPPIVARVTAASAAALALAPGVPVYASFKAGEARVS
ncbi:MAG TPA: ABC transporter ATP-binding protein [Candidatus Eremiobacteraceae bacterium]|jgi:molybdate transport system ATP-binding protein